MSFVHTFLVSLLGCRETPWEIRLRSAYSVKEHCNFFPVYLLDMHLFVGNGNIRPGLGNIQSFDAVHTQEPKILLAFRSHTQVSKT